MTKRHIAVSAAIMLGASGAIYSCGDDEPTTCRGDNTVIVALSLESVWIYRVTDTDTANVVLDTYDDTVRVVDTVRVAGDLWYEMSIAGESWANRDDGFWVWPGDRTSEGDRYLLAQFPALLGDKYTVAAGAVIDTITVNDLAGLVQVPYGSFKAIAYRRADSTGTVVSVAHYVSGIGKVRELTIPDRDTRQTLRTIELLKFTTDGC